MKEFPPISTAFTRTVASREYKLMGDDTAIAVLVEIGEPANDVKTVAGMDWRCHVRIRYGDEMISTYACGVDSFQSLRLASNLVVSRELQALAEERKAKILFLGEECDLGNLQI